MKVKHSRFWTLLLVLLAFAGPAYPQSNEASCIVQVTRPNAPGQGAGNSVRVEGTAKLQVVQHLWVFARHESFRGSDEWWPQNEGKVDDKAGTWSVIAYLGGPPDVGDLFDLAVAVFAPEQNQYLHDWRANGSATGKYPPIKMPLAVCPPTLLVVRKTSHN